MPARLPFLIAAAILFTGCTRIAFQAPVGKPLPDSELDGLVGRWKGEKGILWTVERNPASGGLKVTWVEDGKPRTETLVPTTLGEKEVGIVWAEEEDLAAYVPLRISGADDALALLYPSEEQVKTLVAEGKLSGTFNKEKNAWITSKGDWAGLLERPDFWSIDTCLPFVRIDGPKKADPSAAPARPAAGAPGPHS